jgi:cyclase
VTLRPRVIPAITLQHRSMVKTRRFRDPVYLGDPLNCVRVLNDKEVDELIVLDITASKENRSPDVGFLTELAGECFMPVCYGGGIRSVADADAVLRAGFEKVAVNSASFDGLDVPQGISKAFGAQAVVGAFDVTHRRLGGRVVAQTGAPTRPTRTSPKDWAAQLEQAGVGELLVMSIDRDGTASGYDLDLLAEVLEAVDVPVLLCGGAGSLKDVAEALEHGASGAVGGRLFLTRGQHLASLVSYPTPEAIEALPRQSAAATSP